MRGRVGGNEGTWIGPEHATLVEAAQSILPGDAIVRIARRSACILFSSVMILCAALVWTPAHADEGASGGQVESGSDPNQPVHAGTETVEVTGEGTIAEGAPTSFVTVIRPRERPGTIVSLADLLGSSVGVHVRSWGGLNSFATVSIRGSTPEQVTVLVDGIPLNSPLGGGVNLADIPLTGVESIEVHRGFTPASIGVSSIGGAVNIKTRRPDDADALHATLGYGSWGSAEATGLAMIDSGPMRWVLSGEGSTTRGDFDYLDNNATPFAAGDDEYRRRVNNESWSAALRARGEAPAGAGRTFTLSAEWMGRRQGVPGIDAWGSESASAEAARGFLRAELDWENLAGGIVQARAVLDGEYSTQSFTDTEDPLAALPQDDTTRIGALGGNFGITIEPSSTHRITLLVQPRAEEASVVERLDVPVEPLHLSRASLAAVAEDEIHMASDRLLIAPSIRFDAVRTDGQEAGGAGAPPEAADDPAAFSGRLGALWVLSPRWSLRGNVGRSYRIPSLFELYGNSGTFVGNPDLVPEDGINADLGFTFAGGDMGPLGDLHLEISGFQSRTEELIHFRTLPTRQVKAVNVGEARVTGLEATVSISLFERLALSANLTLQKPENRSDTFAGGEDLAGVPRREAATSAVLDLRPLTIFHRFTYVGENQIDDLGNTNLPPSRQQLTTLPSRYLHDAGVKLRLGQRATGTMEVVNLFDTRVVDVARYPLPGRAIFLKLEASF